jgi:hypothetical protein
MGTACSMDRKKWNAYRILAENHKEEDIGGRLILK